MSHEEEADKCRTRTWPHDLSFAFACLNCTLGAFGVSRFAILTIDFGAAFVAQFLVLTVLFGVPALALFASLGQFLGSGAVDMWRVSPIFKGVGLALVLAHSVFGLYNVVSVAWIFIYLRDSFISNFDRYRWTNCFPGIQYA